MNRIVPLSAILGSVLLTLLSATAARGELITFQFSGTVTSVSVQNVPGLQDFEFPDVGDPFTGSYTFRSDAPDGDDSPSIGAFITVLSDRAIGAAIGEFQFEGAATSIVTTRDYYEAGDWIPSIELTSNPALAQILDRNNFSLVITKEDLFDDPNIVPLAPPPLVGASGALRMSMDSRLNLSPDPFVEIIASLDSLTVVPEPTGLPLIGIVLVLSQLNRHSA